MYIKIDKDRNICTHNDKSQLHIYICRHMIDKPVRISETSRKSKLSKTTAFLYTFSPGFSSRGLEVIYTKDRKYFQVALKHTKRALLFPDDVSKWSTISILKPTGK